MSENNSGDTPIINDAVTADDTGFSSNVDKQLEVENSAAPETTQELQDQVEQAIEDGASKEEIKQMIEEFELKVNGKTIKKTLDWNDKEAIKKELQLSAVAQQSMQKSRELEKAIEEEVKRLMQNPKDVLREMGLDPSKLAEDWLTEEVEQLKKSPEQLEKERIEKEVQQLRAELKKREDGEKQARMLYLQEQEGIKINKEIEEALQAYKSLPDSPKIRARIADAMLFAIENAADLGIDASKLRVEDVIPTVEAELKSEMSNILDMLPEDAFESWGVHKAAERARKKKMESIKKGTSINVTPTTKSLESQESDNKSNKIRLKDYFRNL